MRTPLEGWGQKQGSDDMIVDQCYLSVKLTEKSVRETRKATIVAWVSAWATIVATIVAVIALFKS